MLIVAPMISIESDRRANDHERNRVSEAGYLVVLWSYLVVLWSYLVVLWR
jgi:hypothetical protein